jgi:hypothetical protein
MTTLVDALTEHFPTGLRSQPGIIVATGEVFEGPIRCECWCGASFAGTDEQEVRQLWAEHVTALRQPSSVSGLEDVLSRLRDNLASAPAEAEKCFVSLDDHRTILAALPLDEVSDESRS